MTRHLLTIRPFRAYNRGMKNQELRIDRADGRDIPRIGELLLQVNDVHAAIRPDLFCRGGRKYTDEALAALLQDKTRPVFAARIDGILVGYAFCILQTHAGANEPPHTTLYIDDLCVDAQARGKGIGRRLYEHVLGYARESGCHNVTLNVWAGNDAAKRFYESLGLHIQKYGMEVVL